MADKPKKYCDGIDCAFCGEKEPCIYKIANRLESELKHKEQEYEELKFKVHDLRQLRELDREARERFIQQLNQLKAENSKLKQRIIEIDRSYKNRQEELEQTLAEIKEIAEQQVPYINLGQVKTCTEVEYDYVGKIWNLEQRMYNILQKIAECEVE